MFLRNCHGESQSTIDAVMPRRLAWRPHPQNLEGFLRGKILEINLLRVAVLLDNLRSASSGCVDLRRCIIGRLDFTCGNRVGHDHLPASQGQSL